MINRYSISYIRRMVEAIKDGISKIITYVSTPLHALVLLAILIFFLLRVEGFPDITHYILIGLFGLIVMVIILFMIIDPKKLQFTGKEIITWQRERLGDSELQRGYLIGEVHGEPSPIDDFDEQNDEEI